MPEHQQQRTPDASPVTREGGRFLERRRPARITSRRNPRLKRRAANRGPPLDLARDGGALPGHGQARAVRLGAPCDQDADLRLQTRSSTSTRSAPTALPARRRRFDPRPGERGGEETCATANIEADRCAIRGDCAPCACCGRRRKKRHDSWCSSRASRRQRRSTPSAPRPSGARRRRRSRRRASRRLRSRTTRSRGR